MLKTRRIDGIVKCISIFQDGGGETVRMDMLKKSWQSAEYTDLHLQELIVWQIDSMDISGNVKWRSIWRLKS